MDTDCRDGVEGRILSADIRRQGVKSLQDNWPGKLRTALLYSGLTVQSTSPPGPLSESSERGSALQVDGMKCALMVYSGHYTQGSGSRRTSRLKWRRAAPRRHRLSGWGRKTSVVVSHQEGRGDIAARQLAGEAANQPALLRADGAIYLTPRPPLRIIREGERAASRRYEMRTYGLFRALYARFRFASYFSIEVAKGGAAWTLTVGMG